MRPLFEYLILAFEEPCWVIKSGVINTPLNPNTDLVVILNQLGAQGFHIVGSGGSMDDHAGPAMFILSRMYVAGEEVEEKPEKPKRKYFGEGEGENGDGNPARE